MAKRKTKKTEPPVTIQHCNFTGVHWDAQAIDAVLNVSQALLNLTTLFKSQQIECCIAIKQEEK